jgi:hypothetical protein
MLFHLITHSGHALPTLRTSTGGTLGDTYCFQLVSHSDGFAYVKYSLAPGYVLAGVPAYYITKERAVRLRRERSGHTYGSMSTNAD